MPDPTNSATDSSKGPRPRKRPEKTPQKPAPASDAASSAEDSGPVCVISMTAIDRDSMISMAAYYRAERRNFEPGRELEDWLAAESEIDALLMVSADGKKSSA